MEPAEFLFRQALLRGLPLSDAADAAMAADPMFDLALELRRMIQEGVIASFALTEAKETAP